MKPKTDFSNAPSERVVAALGQRLDAIRLSRNITQATLARDAGVSRSTMTRLADGQGVSLDSFVRVVQALKLGEHLEALLPDADVRPVERLRFEGGERQRARAKKKTSSAWEWGDRQNSDGNNE